MFEQRPQRQLDVTGLAGAGDDLRGQQRVAAEGKEIIAQADGRQAQHFAPDAGDLLLQFGHGLDVFANLPLRFRQGATVEFAARAEGHLVQPHQLSRDHVFRQLRRQRRFQASRLRIDGLSSVGGGEVTDQLSTRRRFAHQHHRLGDTLLRQQTGFDFLWLDAETAQLDLLIEATEILDHAIASPACTITGAVQTRAVLAQWIDDKAFRRQARTAQIATRQAAATDAQLTRHTGRHRIELAVEHAADHIAQWPANRRAFAIGAGALPVGDVDRGFGRAVAVVQLYGRQLRQHAVAQLRWQGFAAGEYAAQAGA
ncbi:hypothetical protein D3C75_513840 [compost metagenome]